MIARQPGIRVQTIGAYGSVATPCPEDLGLFACRRWQRPTARNTEIEFHTVLSTTRNSLAINGGSMVVHYQKLFVVVDRLLDMTKHLLACVHLAQIGIRVSTPRECCCYGCNIFSSPFIPLRTYRILRRILGPLMADPAGRLYYFSWRGSFRTHLLGDFWQPDAKFDTLVRKTTTSLTLESPFSALSIAPLRHVVDQSMGPSGRVSQ